MTETYHEAGQVEGSLQPLLVALGLTLLLAGLVILPVGLLGVLLLVYALQGWLKEEVALWPKRELATDSKDGRLTITIIIITEVILFGAFFGFWFWARNYAIGKWPPEGVELDLVFTGLNTLILLASGATAHKAHLELKAGRPTKVLVWLYLTLLLGLVFLAGQAYEYVTAGFTPGSHSFGTAFFALTGLHGLHVIVGLLSLGVMVWLVQTRSLKEDRSGLFEGVITYWHFVDVVWVVLFMVVYLRWV